MPVELDNEIALVRLAQSGSTESFGILVNRYEQQIFRLARAITKDNQDAEDALQETFLRAYSNIHRFNGDSRFYTWLASLAMNETLLKQQAREVHNRVSFDEPAGTGEELSTPGDIRDWRENPEESCSETELIAILSQALEALAIQLRAVFALHDMEGFSLEETASVLGLPLQAVKAYSMRARQTLRQSLSVWFESLSVPAGEQGGCESVRNFPGAALAEDRECT